MLPPVPVCLSIIMGRICALCRPFQHFGNSQHWLCSTREPSLTELKTNTPTPAPLDHASCTACWIPGEARFGWPRSLPIKQARPGRFPACQHVAGTLPRHPIVCAPLQPPATPATSASPPPFPRGNASRDAAAAPDAAVHAATHHANSILSSWRCYSGGAAREHGLGLWAGWVRVCKHSDSMAHLLAYTATACYTSWCVGCTIFCPVNYADMSIASREGGVRFCSTLLELPDNKPDKDSRVVDHDNKQTARLERCIT